MTKKIIAMSTGVITNYVLHILMGLILYLSFNSLTSYDSSLLIMLFLALLSVVYSWESYFVNYNTSHILKSSIIYGTVDTSTWFGTTIKTKVLKIPASLSYSAPEAKNITNTSPNDTSNDVSISNHATSNDNAINNLDGNSVLNYENVAKYKESFHAVRENLEDIAKHKVHLMDTLCNEVKRLEKFSNTLESYISADNFMVHFNPYNYNDMYNFLFHNHFIELGISILLGSLIIRLFSGNGSNIYTLLSEFVLLGKSFILSAFKIWYKITNFIFKTRPPKLPPSSDPAVNKKRAYSLAYAKANRVRDRYKVQANQRRYRARNREKLLLQGGNGGGGGDDPNKNQDKDKSFNNWVGLVEILINLLASLTLILASITNSVVIPDIDIATVGNAITYIANNMEFIYSDHPEFGSEYRELIYGWPITLNHINNLDFENATANLRALINILSGILDYIHPNCVDLIDTEDIPGQLS